jgi:hypothetical protein
MKTVTADLSLLAWLSRLSAVALSERLGIAPRTWHAWRRQGRAPASVVLWLEVQSGELPWPAWRGWRQADGRLYAPSWRDGFTPTEVLGAWWHRQEILALRRELSAVRAELAVIRRLPMPRSGR